MALSTPKGTVALDFEKVGDHLTVRWTERDGPNVERPKEQGFGTRLLRRSGMKTHLEFRPEGLTCSMKIPVA